MEGGREGEGVRREGEGSERGMGVREGTERGRREVSEIIRMHMSQQHIMYTTCTQCMDLKKDLSSLIIKNL